MNPTAEQKAHEFLQVAALYRLGELPTESSHTMTVKLSDWAQSDLLRGVDVLKQIDLQALNRLHEKVDEIEGLRQSIQKTLESGHKVYLCGCGATGRLSLSLECLWRELHPGSESVRSFMAGGDVALVHSLEGFEDYPEYGAQHLREMGFADGDLLISCTEGGETPYVIGATEEALKLSTVNPYYLYCNPDGVLRDQVERSKRVIENKEIQKINLFVGPMALAGSTRMQASTVLQLAVGCALFFTDKDQISTQLRQFINSLTKSDLSVLVPFIECESEIYQNQEDLIYCANDFSITVFTDTTERAPTFSLPAFHPSDVQSSENLSLCYLCLPKTETAREAWHSLLGRVPRPLNWEPEKTSTQYLQSFDFSFHAKALRQRLQKSKSQNEFHIFQRGHYLHWKLNDLEQQFDLSAQSHLLLQHIFLKLILNIHSTLIMGRLGRYKHNLMTWVQPTNGKLIDRSTRYVIQLLKDDGYTVAYENAVLEIFRQLENIKPSESIVLKTFESLKKTADPIDRAPN